MKCNSDQYLATLKIGKIENIDFFSDIKVK